MDWVIVADATPRFGVEPPDDTRFAEAGDSRGTLESRHGGFTAVAGESRV